MMKKPVVFFLFAWLGLADSLPRQLELPRRNLPREKLSSSSSSGSDDREKIQRYENLLRETRAEDIELWHAAASASRAYSKCKNPDGSIETIGGSKSKTGSMMSSKTSSKKNTMMGSTGQKSCNGKMGSATCSPAVYPTETPTMNPDTTETPTSSPTMDPTMNPTMHPSMSPSMNPSTSPSVSPTVVPTTMPTMTPTKLPTTNVPKIPTVSPTKCHDKSCKPSNKVTNGSKSKMQTMGSSKMSKSNKRKRYDDVDLPWCSDFAPTSSPTSSPTRLADFDRCNKIRDGTGDSTGLVESQEFKLFVVVESAMALGSDFAEKLNAAMRAILALASNCRLADFSSIGRRRRLQSTPDVVELDGFSEVDLAGKTCQEVFGVQVSAAVCTAFESLVRAFNGEILADIAQICNDFGPDLAETLGVEKIHCVVETPPYTIAVPSQVNQQGSPVATAAPTQSPTSSKNAGRITTNEGDRLEAGGWIGIAAGIAVLLSICLCIVCARRREEEDEESGGDRAIGYTKTMDTGSSVMTGDDNSRDVEARPLAVFVNPGMSTDPDNEVHDFDDPPIFRTRETRPDQAPKEPDTDVAPTDEEEEHRIARNFVSRRHESLDELMRSPSPPAQPGAPTRSYRDPVEQPSSSSPYQDIILHEKGQTCSSPTCRLCEDRRQGGSLAPNVTGWRSPKVGPDRSYVQEDTVEL